MPKGDAAGGAYLTASQSGQRDRLVAAWRLLDGSESGLEVQAHFLKITIAACT